MINVRGMISGRSGVMVHKTASQIAQELQACIGCNECLLACPALAEPIRIDALNRETFSGSLRACSQVRARVLPMWGVCRPLPRRAASRRDDDVAESASAAL